jgi:tetratricopeptide (TPR) repeat protein
MAENELIDEYVHERLSDEERALFVKHRLQTPQQNQKLAFATALNEASRERAVSRAKVVTLAERAPTRTVFSPAFMKIAAVVIVAVGLALALWFWLGSRESDVDRGMLALNRAYKNERLVESRISGVNHSPLPNVRGASSPNIDGRARDEAEFVLRNAANSKGDAASLHALGRVYLAEKKLDLAQQQFEQALKLDPNNPQLHSDLGATYLEMGRAQRSDDEAKADESFRKSLQHLDRALQLNNSLLEALFNRALLLQQLKSLPQAEEAWQTYLQKDSTSPWADEAHRNLQKIQEDNKVPRRSVRNLRRSCEGLWSFPGLRCA